MSDISLVKVPPVFIYMMDAGHGWRLVSEKDAESIGFTADSFSEYSYRSKEGVFALEEDCDAPKFIGAWEAIHGKADIIEKHYEDAVVRKWPRIK